MTQSIRRLSSFLVAAAIITFIAALPTNTFAAGGVIYVKVLVDEEEATRPTVWKERLKTRVEAASSIISEYCSIKFSVGSYGTWNSDNRLNDLNRTLREFEQEVRPRPSQIAIGFSSQYKFHKGRNGLGGTRGPLSSHIILRESARNIFERERVEALVHELGHFLGAAHSSSRVSAMRPVIGDGQARARDFRIGFDPQNARVLRLVATEVSLMRVRRFRDLSPKTKEIIRGEYAKLVKQLPNDPTAKRFITMIDRSTSKRQELPVLGGKKR